MTRILGALRSGLKFGGRRFFKTCVGRSSASSVLGEASSMRQGDVIHGYELKEVEYIKSLEVTGLLFEHERSGAEHLHLAKDDENSAFGVAFRTLPTKEYHDTGVAHILEHVVMCGSEHYPVRDPFFKMLTRSLSSFMNAMTASDWTMYPYASPNEKDYMNLLNVYLDLTFCPLLREMDFLQEGIRLEPEDLNDAKSKLGFKGVVFNEMKGVFSNPDNVFGRRLMNLLLPSGPYSYESGGDPLAIPQLSHAQLKKVLSNPLSSVECEVSYLWETTR